MNWVDGKISSLICSYGWRWGRRWRRKPHGERRRPTASNCPRSAPASSPALTSPTATPAPPSPTSKVLTKKADIFGFHGLDSEVVVVAGGKEMYGMGVLAVADVVHAAEAHLSVYEAMERGVRGRFICFDSVVSGASEAARLRSQFRHPAAFDASDGEETTAAAPFSYRLCNHKLSTLMSVSVP